jgi:hypothetical protein
MVLLMILANTVLMLTGYIINLKGQGSRGNFRDNLDKIPTEKDL